MPSYHKYVFDILKRQFVGRFEEMYQAEKREGFDSWHQDDLRARSDVEVCRGILEGRQYSTLIDLGCGKGALTAALAVSAHRAFGFDISKTAVDIAASRFPSIEFHALDIADTQKVARVLQEFIGEEETQNMVVLAQVLSYLEDWYEILRTIGSFRVDVLILLYIPKNPIGFVKSTSDLLGAVKDFFDEVQIQEVEGGQVVLLASSPKNAEAT
jgi:SAM-dependent methyltransferase